ncbi:MAG: bifunctional adenosylcobinamide kinase/adenosylcobinamide-phosphate guanylyltransferase [Rubrobacter sp.]
MKAGRMVFVTGAARSGKSRYAEELVASLGGSSPSSVVYVATAEALDDEMRRRVGQHRKRRPPGWTTIEARRDIADELRRSGFSKGVVLLDCVSLLVSNLLLDAAEATGEGDPDLERRVWAETEGELAGLGGLLRETGADCVFVSNEVGWGVVPPHRLGRVYRDLLGRANQRVAANSDFAVLLVAGLPVLLKGEPPAPSPHE